MRKLRHNEIPRPDPGELHGLPRHPVRVILNDVRSIHNVGSIFRTSDAARIDHLYLTGITGTPDHPKMHKTALGSQDAVPWSRHSDVRHLFDTLRIDGWTMAVLEITDTPTRVQDLQLGHFPLCLIVGHEVHGVDDELVSNAALAIEIPQFGMKQSLNVSVAYGIAVFGIVQRYRSLAGAGI